MQHIQVAVGVIVKDGHVLLAKRPEHLHQGNKWEFPGGKIEAGESLEQAIVRELSEELAIEVSQQHAWFSLDYDYPEKRVSLHMSIVSAFTGEPRGNEGQPVEWVAISELGQFTFPDANQPIIDKLQASDWD
ncbi:8-oxo-dGTP diphosphatase MutT [Alteromonas sp. ASW11-36]|uniref:8-oxo-dGTP diphosphatase n=1 Tax=Alteromonas arenosi TaxID=3055817 RepID=A0ABT7STL3_9ALTE|nr:8-oxo-dGTP diphosphatase MutT [Alteromonas sp. ASW11-36]MDM7859539.1 8-oxo-dGTP diphosphatase MutT [Alteromonas sp. ASW11-36]